MTKEFKGQYFYANGKRKSAIAKVRLYKGDGQVIVNERDIKEWQDYKEQAQKILTPLKVTGMDGNFDLSIKVIGGGHNAQAEAIRLGIAKALVVFDPTLKGTLKKLGLISRDQRVKERKKPGLKSARRAPQFSKR
jgi:small subunit ribosomal protein S9